MRLRLGLETALVVAAVVAFVMYGGAERRAGVADMLREHAIDSANVNAKARDLARAAMAAETQRADDAMHRAAVADSTARAMGDVLELTRQARDRAREALAAATTVEDSLGALLRKSVADDATIANQQRVIAAREREAAALRVSVAALYAAADTAGHQLARDAAVDAQLRAALEASRPSRLRRWGERAAWLAVGYTVAKLTP